MDYLVGQFRSVLGQELIVKESTSTTATTLPPGPAHRQRRPSRPLPPLEPLPTVRSGPPRKMIRAATTERPDATIRTGPPTHMTPPPVLERGHRRRRASPAVLPPVGQPQAPHDLIPTAVLRPYKPAPPQRSPAVRWPELATDATTRRRFVEADTVRYLPPRHPDELIPLPHRGLAASRRRGTTVSGWEQPYASLEITGTALPRQRRGWPRVVTAVGLAALILALSGCTVYLLGLLE